MAFKLIDAVVRLFVNKDELTKGLADSKKEVEGFSKEAKKFANELGQELGNLVIGASLAATIVELGRAAIEGAADLHLLAQETGFTAEQLSRLQYASGESADSFSTAIRTFNQRITEAVQHGGQAQATFQSVGISLDFLKTHSPYEVLMRVSDAFAKSADGAGKVTVASEFFGARTGTHLIPTLDKGSEALRQLGDEADRTGATMSGQTAKSAEELRTSVVRLKDSLLGIIAIPLTQYFTFLSIALNLSLYRFGEAGKQIKEISGQLFSAFKSVDEQMKKATSGESGDKKPPLQNLVLAIIQANAQLDIQNVKIREQIALAEHNAPLAERLAQKAAEMQERQLTAYNRLDPLRARELTNNAELLRVTQSRLAAEEQERKFNEQFLGEEISLRGQILSIILKAQEAERIAIEDERRLKQEQLGNQLQAEVQRAQDTIKNNEELGRRIKEIYDRYNELDVESEALKNAKKLALDRKYGTDQQAIIDQLILKQKTWGEQVISAIDAVQQAFETQLGAALFSAVTGHIDGVKQAFRSLADDILRTITNLMAQRIVAMFIKYFFGENTIAPSGTVSTSTTVPSSSGGVGALSAPAFGGAIPISTKVGISSAPAIGGSPGGGDVYHRITIAFAPDFVPAMAGKVAPFVRRSDGEIIAVVGRELLENGSLRGVVRAMGQ